MKWSRTMASLSNFQCGWRFIACRVILWFNGLLRGLGRWIFHLSLTGGLHRLYKRWSLERQERMTIDEIRKRYGDSTES